MSTDSTLSTTNLKDKHKCAVGGYCIHPSHLVKNTMSERKQQIRKNFRDACYKRDDYKCVMCGMKSSKDKAEQELDAHHITDRTLMINGGYVKENGISLCEECHKKAEEFHSIGMAYPGYAPDDLYKKINSSYEKAVEASQRLS